MRDTIERLLIDTSGAAAAEYALILAIIGAVIATGLVRFRREIESTIDVAGDTIAAARGIQTGN
jgi:Flp pilus assembly pilin Flp